MNENDVIQPVKLINVRQVFKEKNASLARFIPGFVFRYLERIVHQQEINDFLTVHGKKSGMDFVRASIEGFNVSIRVEGAQHIPHEGKYVFVANHPWGGFDGLLLLEVISRYFSDLKFLVNDILMNITNLHPVFIPVNKHGKQASDAAKRIDETFRSDAQILTFPAGFVSRYIGGQVMDLPWKKNFITKAVQHQRDVIPVFFNGKNSKFFYRLYRIRKFLGIKANIEMLYLVDETYRHSNKSIVVTFGEPIPWNTFDKSRTPVQWARWVKEKVYALGGVTKVPV